MAEWKRVGWQYGMALFGFRTFAYVLRTRCLMATKAIARA